jgi:FkbM family methyltransferase
MNSLQTISSFLQSIPALRGKRRICKMLLDITGISKRKNLQIATKSGVFELPNLVEIISFELFVNGYYERGLVELLRKSIPKNGVFIDIGGNIGSISISLALSRPDIKMISVEASPWIYRVLHKNVELNNVKNIITLNKAVYNESNKELPMYAPKDLFGKGSLKPVFTNDSESVLTITVDDISQNFNLGKIDFIKVDVEGFEVCVFQGMTKTIERDKPGIIFEYSKWTESSVGFKAGAAQTELLERGYELQYLDHDFIPSGAKKNEMISNDSANILAS